MAGDLSACAWPLARLGEALAALAARSGLAASKLDSSDPPVELAGDGEGLSRWIQAAGARLGIEAESATLPYVGLEAALASAGPALLRLPAEGDALFLAVVGGGKRSVPVLGPDHAVRHISAARIREALCRELEAPLAAQTDPLLREAGVPKRRQSRARSVILEERLRARQLGDCWLLRLAPGAPFWTQWRRARLPHKLALLGGVHLAQYVLWLLAWWMVGQGALEGRLDRGWLLAWALLLATMIPFRVLGTWLQGRVAIGAGGLLKLRLLAGALRLEPDEIRHQGAGQLLGRVTESQAVESLALSGGFLALVAAIELVLAAAVLVAGAGGWLHAVLLAAWVALSLAVARRYLERGRAWSLERLEMTHDLIERMVGHRTQLAQEPREAWHRGEDEALERYLERSHAMDRTGATLMALVPRGWLVLGVLALAPGFVSGRAGAAALAVAVGGVLLAFRALKRLAAGLWQLVGAEIAWRQVAPLFHAAARPEVLGSPDFTVGSRAVKEGGLQPVVDAQDLVFRYHDRAEPVLQGCSLRILRGERLVLEGASGGGKSTLAALLTGLRQPESGLLLLDGLDRRTLGSEGWRRRVVAAPQFHENHVLTGTFAFNLMMGRRWPPLPEDFPEMENVCRELGLEEVLARMPAGLLQTVGETGWQLSHGERSRLYIARALLQNAELVVLDESFAALDPENLRRAIHCVLARARTVLVIAHR